MFIRLQNLTDWFTYTVLHLSVSAHVAQALNFFIFDSIKIFILLILIVHIMTLINHYLPVEKIRDFLARNKLYGLEYLFASFFGVITPFCSCSAIPLFVGFLKAGIPLGVTTTFLITSPMVNEVAIALLAGLFGFKIMALYVITGILLGILGGFIIGKLKMENQVADFIIKARKTSDTMNQHIKKKFTLLLKQISNESFSLIWKIMPYVLLGVAVGGVIHGFVPTGFFESYIAKSNPFAVPLAVIIGVPMYTNSAGVIPVVQSLIAKGVPIGTALAFMMAVIGLSLPEFLILRKVMKPKLLFSYFGIVALFMIIAGYIFNRLL
ncbi:MAG: permease [candidate division SR1 bacterium]|nr:permease [candidate division SR1 bacterium]